MNINCRGRLLDLSEPKIMGILNITPDSFYDGGKYINREAISKRANEILSEGGSIIDVGAYSSRSGAQEISSSEEKKRLDIALDQIRKDFPDAIISVDTFRADVAEYVIEHYDVDMINDISAGILDTKMLEVVAYYHVPYIMMHMKGTPQTMQTNPIYKDVVADVIYYFSERIRKTALLGIPDVIIDPGFGFGKTLDHNYEILANLDAFKILQKPLLVGLSRKSMIYKLLNKTPDQSLAGTISVNTIALTKGANLLRVHDVQEASDCIAIFNKFSQFKSFEYNNLFDLE